MNSHLVVASTLLVAAAAAQAPAWTQLGGPAVTVSGTGALTRAPAGVGSVGVAWHDYVSGSTFAFGNPGWSIATTGTGPTGLMFAAMAGHQYAAVSFGGLTGTGMFSNLADGLSLAGGFATWGPAPSGPPARMMHSMTAVGTSYIVLFGGFDGANALNDVWTYSFFTSTWTPRVPTGLQPPPRTFASLSEGAGGTVVLFGGVDGSNQIVGDTWQLTFTFLSPTWAQIGGVAPSPRASAGMAWDPVRKVAVLQGGQVATGSLSDTWELRNDSGAPLWRSAITSGATVSPGAQLVFDNASGKILAVAPAIGTGNLDTFEFTPSVASYSTTSPTPWTCSATGAPLLMTVQGNDLPIVGATFHMELRNAAPGALLVGGVELLPALTSVPPPVTSCGCPYYQNSPVGFSFANVGPVSPFDLAIANNPALIGASFSVEGYHVDFSTCGISTTSVLRLNVGT